MTVCLTGDVHHMSLETRDQEYMDRTEVEAAIEYAEVAAEYDVPVTLFVTGKAAEEEPERVKRLAVMENVEIGGHNYWAFDTLIHKGGGGESLARGTVRVRFSAGRSERPSRRSKSSGSRSRRGAITRIDTTGTRRRCCRRRVSRIFRRGGTGRRGSRGGRIDCGSDKHAARSRARVSRVSDAGIRGRNDFEGPFGEDSVEVEEWVEWVLGRVSEQGWCDNHTRSPGVYVVGRRF